jgi:hypothetical protein
MKRLFPSSNAHAWGLLQTAYSYFRLGFWRADQGCGVQVGSLTHSVMQSFVVFHVVNRLKKEHTASILVVEM